MMTGLAARAQVKIEGTVQGIGFRPFVYRIARELDLAGWIMNSPYGVVIEVEGAPDAIDRLLDRIHTAAPRGARIDRMSCHSIPARGDAAFAILQNLDEGPARLSVSPDLATCADCVAELLNPADRRFRYPWLSCSRCGPRYSMVTGVSYERAYTTMTRFNLCEACRGEYEDPADRRFHAESTACPVCGPGIALRDAAGHMTAEGERAIQEAVYMLRDGGIVAVKGIGGFHLWVNAASDAAVHRLRERKQRPHKPFAVMFPSLEAVQTHCILSPEEAEWLTSPQGPIVVLQRTGWKALAQEIAPGQTTIGALLPYAPLHHLLMNELGSPVVATSGNRSTEPIVTDDQEARHRMAGIADAFLVHNRPIARPVDDSLMRIAKSGPIVLRRARGLVPQMIRLPEAIAHCTEGPVLAVGGHHKNTVALLHGDHVMVSQHLGDLSTVETECAVRQAIDDLQWLSRVTPHAIACDLHPDYRSTHLAAELAARWNVPLIPVQHHHAHVAACMVEQGVTDEVLGVAWDGAGYGTDRSLWGGEFLAATFLDSRRVGHLHPFRLPGGERAAREPRRAALAVRWETFGPQGCGTGSAEAPEWREQERLLTAMLNQHIHSPVTTSMGRLFDAVASILDLCQIASFEGQAAMAVEQKGLSSYGEDGLYPIPLSSADDGLQCWVADWRPMIRQITGDLRTGIERSLIAHRFHRSLAELIGQMAEQIGLKQIVLTGGCFQNGLLLDLARARLESAGFVVFSHRKVPPNDGGLALGQAVVAATKLGRRESASSTI